MIKNLFKKNVKLINLETFNCTTSNFTKRWLKNLKKYQVKQKV